MLYKQTPAAASTFSNECHCELVRTSFEGKVWYLLWHRRKNDELRGRFYSEEQKESTFSSYRLSVFSSFRFKFQYDVSQEYPQDIINGNCNNQNTDISTTSESKLSPKCKMKSPYRNKKSERRCSTSLFP